MENHRTKADPILAPRPSVLADHRRIAELGEALAEESWCQIAAGQQISPCPEKMMQSHQLATEILNRQPVTVGDAALLARLVANGFAADAMALAAHQPPMKASGLHYKSMTGLCTLIEFLCTASGTDFEELQLPYVFNPDHNKGLNNHANA